MQRFCRASLLAFVAEDALRSVFPLARFFIDLHIHGTNPPALPAMDAFTLIAMDAQQRKITHGPKKHRNGAEIFAERPIILEGEGQRDARKVIERVSHEEQPEHYLLQIGDLHQKQPGHQC